ncbi:aldo/keto reductase [Lactiplantibacillus paraplantarum]|uniref:Aldo/keto reductase n=1 Tax=Lactiplantibacillus paraplantarum TaxID=60520 RepID=A0AAD0X6L6_9LACO|nr:aldo/keto reductase [Lactiplantibacillus paraplantarum]AVW10464.1 aldo/keto reductase [Lactiplantibacillus paraplantarum]AYJ38707.1 aldo/keto reductase [Lactiplantibacillus paraplantarum]KRL51529.1 aldo keto reductase [Lactiplantibacillus paraplantarum DSM 10667]MCU4683794.1 aldo/keto reductase [Lactiplantibacillus paraplantarum]MDL2061272.1 aldo/keto reductase [Lactiplantibacillus paraplantarum]
MEYRQFGHTGLQVSPLCLGTMGFGTPGNSMFPWAIGEPESTQIVKKALDLGLNFFDTANIYSHGDSERLLGSALNQLADRDQIIVATKVFFTEKNAPNLAGLSRKAIFTQLDKSLTRLNMDYVDLYIIHRWDYHTPIEETMAALHQVVQSGKARYIGASAMYAWQFEKAQAIAKANGWTEFVSMQNHLNLLYREEEREMLPLCADQNIAVTPYSPLASGRLAHQPNQTTQRSQTDTVQVSKYGATESEDQAIIDAVGQVARKHGVNRSQIALAWLLQKPEVTAPIIGATKVAHLTSAIDALKVKLDASDIQALEAPYLPHPVVGAYAPGTTDYQR